jgi:nucleoside-diphosphate-sugar epimerase
MRIFVAGASGAIGRPLLPLLVDAGHEVVGTTRSEARAERIRAAGAEAVILDVHDLDRLREVVTDAKPDVVINELTGLPDALDFRDRDALVPTNALRGQVAPALAQIAADAGARRLISLSVAFFYAPVGDPVKSEEDPLLSMPGDHPLAAAVEALRAMEMATTGTTGIEGVVLRYGQFYGPGTYYAADGSTATEVRRRRYPVVGGGDGVFSFIHVDDAAAATVAALDHGPAGVYNIVDDEPARMAEWLPEYAQIIGAKRPWRVPAWIARLIAGGDAVSFVTQARGADNAKAKRELAWKPIYPSWRQGFREALG